MSAPKANPYDAVVRSDRFRRELLAAQKRKTDREFLEACEARARDLYPELKTARMN